MARSRLKSSSKELESHPSIGAQAEINADIIEIIVNLFMRDPLFRI